MHLDLSDFEPTTELARAKTLPARWYVDPDFWSFERERIFARCWQLLCAVADVSRRGDHVSVEIAGEPVVVVRGDDARLRAFSNVCRHRAGPVACGRGNRKTLQCFYHGWTYGLDGRLLRAPEFDGVRDWDPQEVRLPEIEVRTWGPFVLGNLDRSAAPLEEAFGEIRTAVEASDLAFEGVELMERREYRIRCNWKVYVDNYLEGYHIPIAHPALFRELDYDRYRVDTYRLHSAQFAPMRRSRNEGDQQGRVYGEDEPGPLYYWVFPNLMLNFYPGSLQLNLVLPIDHENTLTIFEWYTRGDDGTSRDRLARSIAFSEQVQQEDIFLCESVQRGLRSRTYGQGRFSVRRENGVHHFQSLVHEFLTRA